VRLFQKTADLSQPCPRCKAQSSVEMYSLSRAVRFALAGLVLAGMALDCVTPRWSRISEFFTFLAIAGLLLGEHVRCRSCGQVLAKELGDGWR
jgi:phage FluMu protein Com